ncbi:DUF2911 domain-containing protein [Algibacter lectus]|uniref:DUF2911 family protein n=1 Tax=Algibacter lectus TaxID=221126 RepID=A0A090V9Y3_9FLAO|nr:DUF2911 domain-containing protein [Algibacter lectus]MWW23406.1 DUF2911 domain-containing protein [Algibacter lectus]TDY63917.1 DUF2911 family protein [Algibacter lectus]GAL61601.1 hypothetical protein JCM19300_1424 [Algibacter lectus]SFC23467.1 Protein of unknown function [Algibacter lectus]
MNTFLKRVLISLTVIALGLFLYSTFVENIFAPRLSPKDTVKFELNDLELKVFYNRPSKKNRVIFGALVPFDKVWRTGANEATTFETNKPLEVKGMPLPAGKYTLWTVPKDSVWTVIFNTKQYSWGVDSEMKPMWDPNYDALSIEVPVRDLKKPVEQFTIAFDNSTDDLFLTMAWDVVKVSVPLK